MKTHNDENSYYAVRFVPQQAHTGRPYTCDLDRSFHGSITDATERRDFLLSPEGIAERAAKAESARQRRAAYEEHVARKQQEQEWRRATRLEMDPFFEDGLEVYA